MYYIFHSNLPSMLPGQGWEVSQPSAGFSNSLQQQRVEESCRSCDLNFGAALDLTCCRILSLTRTSKQSWKGPQSVPHNDGVDRSPSSQKPQATIPVNSPVLRQSRPKYGPLAFQGRSYQPNPMTTGGGPGSASARLCGPDLRTGPRPTGLPCVAPGWCPEICRRSVVNSPSMAGLGCWVVGGLLYTGFSIESVGSGAWGIGWGGDSRGFSRLVGV